LGIIPWAGSSLTIQTRLHLVYPRNKAVRPRALSSPRSPFRARAETLSIFNLIDPSGKPCLLLSHSDRIHCKNETFFAYFCHLLVTYGASECHPLMSFSGCCKLATKWTSTSGKTNYSSEREIGVPRASKALHHLIQLTCFLMISHGGDFYIGRAQLRMTNFCRQVCDLLTSSLWRPLAEIGANRYSYTP